MAFAALYADDASIVTAEVKAAKAATSLPRIVTVLKSLHREQAIELAATDDDQKTRASVNDISSHAVSLMNDALSASGTKVQTISTQAQAVQQTTDRNGTVHTRQHGLDANSTSVLKQVISEAQQIESASKDLDTLTNTSNTAVLQSQAKQIEDNANNLLITNWRATETTTASRR